MKIFLPALSLFSALFLSPATASTLIVPAYGNTSAQFNGILSAARQSSLIAVINPNDGAGGGTVGKTATFAKKIQASCILAAGYINTNYGRRSLDAIRGDINKYRNAYGAKAIFLDEFSDSSADIGAYREIYNYAKSKGMKVIGNPGTSVPRGYADVTDVLITYEDTFGAGFSRYKQKSWTKSYPKKKFGVIVNSTKDYQAVISKANSQHAEFVFATDGTEPSPYGKLPGYFDEQVSAVKGRGINAQAIPEPSSIGLLLAGFCAWAGLSRNRRKVLP